MWLLHIEICLNLQEQLAHRTRVTKVWRRGILQRNDVHSNAEWPKQCLVLWSKEGDKGAITWSWKFVVGAYSDGLCVRSLPGSIHLHSYVSFQCHQSSSTMSGKLGISLSFSFFFLYVCFSFFLFLLLSTCPPSLLLVFLLFLSIYHAHKHGSMWHYYFIGYKASFFLFWLQDRHLFHMLGTHDRFHLRGREHYVAYLGLSCSHSFTCYDISLLCICQFVFYFIMRHYVLRQTFSIL